MRDRAKCVGFGRNDLFMDINIQVALIRGRDETICLSFLNNQGLVRIIPVPHFKPRDPIR
jgi:hypothetical protein